jgi:outer membrane receptor for ferrienterochelin and colicin
MKKIYLLLILQIMIAGTTGKLSGTITDMETGEILPACNVMIRNTVLGTATDIDGDFVILNIAPGNYTVSFSMMGYQTQIIKDIHIAIDQTSKLNVSLVTSIIEGQEVIVLADREMIKFDVTNSEIRVTAKELEVMPVTDITDVIKLQGGVTQDAGGGIHIRGGRNSEVVYMVDGVSMTDVYDGGISVAVENDNIQELQVISGTFNAEYGKAMSGIINMVTKDGGQNFKGHIKYFSGDHISSDPMFRDLTSYNFINDMNIEGSLSGPILSDLITFYSSGRYYQSDGWLNGINTFNMYGDTLFTDRNGNRVRDIAEPFHDTGNGHWDTGEIYWDENNNGQYDNGEMFTDENPNGHWDEGEFLVDTNPNGYNGVWDEGEEFIDIGSHLETFYSGNDTYDADEPFWDINGDGERQNVEPFTDFPENGNEAYAYEAWVGGDGICNPAEGFIDANDNGIYDIDEQFTDTNGNGQWDEAESFTDSGNGHWDSAEKTKTPEIASLNWITKWSSQNKLSFKLRPNINLRLKYIISRESSQGYDHGRQLVLEGRNTHYNHGELYGLNLSHSLSSKTFYDLNITRFRKMYESYLFEDENDDRYYIPDEWYSSMVGQTPDTQNGEYDEGEGGVGAELYHDENQNGMYDIGEWFYDSSDFKYGNQLTDEDGNPLNYYPQHSFSRWGMNTSRFKRETITDQAKLDLTSQMNKYNQVKFGIEYQIHNLELDSYALMDSSENDMTFTPVVPELGALFDLAGNEIPQLQDGLLIHSEDIPSWVTHYHPNRSYYLNKPKEFSAYIQDKIEYGDMIVNIGLRYDWFDPNTWVPTNKHEPYIQNPRNPKLDSLSLEDRLNLNWGDISYVEIDEETGEVTEHTFAEYGGFSDQGNLSEQTGWFKRTTTKSQFSPRLGVAYPISDKGVIHFSYGMFYQIPQFDLLFQNPGYKMPETSGKFGIYGNPDLEPQKTVSYELGLQQEIYHNIKMELTGYFRDVRDWVSTGIPTDLGGGASYFTYVNKDYSNVRGIILSIDKHFSDYYSWHLDYTFQVAEGSNSDPSQEFGAILNNDEPRRSIIPLNWDQTHTLNASIYVGMGHYGSNIIMQMGSGYPYTPEFTNASQTGQSIANVLVDNSRRKQPTINLDLKFFRNIYIKGQRKGKIFLNVYNIFDTRNEINIWADTGRSGSTVHQSTAETLDAEYPEAIRPNTIEEYYNHPEWYSSPREIQFGLELSW